MILDVKLFTLQETEELMGVCHETLVKYIKGGRLKSTLIGGKKMITEENLKKFLQNCE